MQGLIQQERGRLRHVLVSTTRKVEHQNFGGIHFRSHLKDVSHAVCSFECRDDSLGSGEMLEGVQRIVVNEHANRALRRQEVRHVMKHVAQVFFGVGVFAHDATAGRAFRRTAS